MQTNGKRHSRLYTTSVGREGLVTRGTICLQTGILVRESNNYSLSEHIRLPRWSSQAGRNNNSFFESLWSSPSWRAA